MTGKQKAQAVERAVAGDPEIPAGFKVPRYRLVRLNMLEWNIEVGERTWYGLTKWRVIHGACLKTDAHHYVRQNLESRISRYRLDQEITVEPIVEVDPLEILRG